MLSPQHLVESHTPARNKPGPQTGPPVTARPEAKEQHHERKTARSVPRRETPAGGTAFIGGVPAFQHALMDVFAPELLDLLGAINVGKLFCTAEQHRDKGQTEEQQQAPPAAFRRQIPPCAAKHPGDTGYPENHQQDFRAIVEKPRQPSVQLVGHNPFVRGGIKPQALSRRVPTGIGFHQRHQHEEQCPNGKLGGDHAFRHVPKTSPDMRYAGYTTGV